jgi:hypothetical protein
MANPLAGLLSNANNTRSSMRADQMADPRNSRAFQNLVGQEERAEDFDMAQDPNVRKYRAMGESQLEGDIFNQPEQEQMRDDSLRRILAPIALRNQGNIDAQYAQGQGQEEAFNRRQDALNQRQAMTQQNVNQRQQVTQQGMADRQRVTGLQSGKIQAPRPANEGILSRWLTGPSQKALNRQEISRIQGGGGQDEDQVSANPQLGEQGIIQGTPVEWDGQGWAVIEG